MSHGEWYANQDKNYEVWNKRNRNEMLKQHLLFYGIPAVVMIVLIFLGATSK